MSCKDCKYFEGLAEKKGLIYGECRRFPPVFVSVGYCSTSEDFDKPYSPARWGWPIVEQHDYCGEFSEYKEED